MNAIGSPISGMCKRARLTVHLSSWNSPALLIRAKNQALIRRADINVPHRLAGYTV